MAEKTRNTIIDLNDIEQEVIKLKLLHRMEDRQKAGALASEGDFMAGAVTVMSHLISIGLDEEIFWPPALPWYWLIQSGRSLLAELYLQRGEKVNARLIQQITDVRVRRNQYADETIRLLLTIHHGNTDGGGTHIRALVTDYLEEIGEIVIEEEE